MRVLVTVPADRNSEAGVMPPTEVFAEMGKFNEELVKAGVMLAAEGLQPTSKGAKVRFGGGKSTVTDGPFAESKELIAGFWIWQVRSMDEAIEWLRRSPFRHADIEITLRRIYDAEDFGPELTPELKAKEEKLRATVAARQGKPA